MKMLIDKVRRFQHKHVTPEFRTQSTHYHHRDNTTEKKIANTDIFFSLNIWVL